MKLERPIGLGSKTTVNIQGATSHVEGLPKHQYVKALRRTNRSRMLRCDQAMRLSVPNHRMLALLALIPMLDLALPKEAIELEGLYVIRRGFEIISVDLAPKGAMSLTQRYDHPGESKWDGHWGFDGKRLTVTLRYIRAGQKKVVTYTWVPLVWGERLMLVDEMELKAGVITKLFREEADRLNRLGKRDDTEMTLTTVAVRVKERNGKLPIRNGKILAPKEFEALLEGIEIRLPQ